MISSLFQQCIYVFALAGLFIARVYAISSGQRIFVWPLGLLLIISLASALVRDCTFSLSLGGLKFYGNS